MAGQNWFILYYYSTSSLISLVVIFSPSFLVIPFIAHPKAAAHVADPPSFST